MSVYDVVKNVRSEKRIRSLEIVEKIFENPIYLKGDRCFGDSHSIVGGIAEFLKTPVTFIAIQKGRGVEEAVETNFGMPFPEGYRKSVRLMRQAEKFRRPVITFIDTPGAYPGASAEERGQFQAIASCIETMSSLTVPSISFVIGEGGSGGALALSVTNKIYMFEKAIYSILSPEGFASILWKDKGLADRAAELMKIEASDLKNYGIVDEIIRETENVPDYKQIKELIANELKRTYYMTGEQIREDRQKKFRKMGS